MILTIGWPKQAYEDVPLRHISILQSKQLIHSRWNVQWITSLWKNNSNTFCSPPAELGWFFCQNMTKWSGQPRTLSHRTFPLVTIWKQNEVPALCMLKCCAILSDCGGAVVRLQHGDSGSCGLDLEHLTADSRYVHRHHHVGTTEALSNGALKLGRPTIFSWVS